MVDESRIKFFEQSEVLSACGPVSLQIILHYFGIEKSEAELAELCGTTRERGTPRENLISAMEKLGFETQTGSWQSKEESWQTLNHWINEKGVPVVVGWFSVFGEVWDSHYSVAYKLNKDDIWLANPEFYTEEERRQKIAWDNFVTVWFDFDGDYVKNPEDFIARWHLVAYPKNGLS